MTLEIRAVDKSEALSKEEIIREISKELDLQMYVVEDVLRAFTNIYLREVLTTGAFDYPGLPYTHRLIKGAGVGYNPKTKKHEEQLGTCYLSSKIPAGIKAKHQKIFKNIQSK